MKILQSATTMLAGLILLGLSTAAVAQTTATPGVCYASTGNQDGGRLLTIDLNTGAGTLVGPTFGLGARPALAINSSGEIFVMDEGYYAGLYRIDAATGAQTFVGTGLLGDWTLGMAFDENDFLHGQNWLGGDFYTIDTATGLETIIAANALNTWVGMAFDPTDGTLYGSLGYGDDAIYTINKITGTSTLVGPTGLGGSTPDIAFDAAGNLYGLKGGGGGTNNLISIDKSTGAGTVIGPIGFSSVSGLDCFGDPTISVGIDIKPGSDPNSINLCSNGAVPVAIFGSATLDVSNVNTETLRFAEASVKVVGKKDPHSLCSYEDVNGDSYVDVVCHFVTSDIAAIDGESTSATVNGELLDGTAIEGADSVNIVKDTCN